MSKKLEQFSNWYLEQELDFDKKLIELSFKSYRPLLHRKNRLGNWPRSWDDDSIFVQRF